MAPRARIGLGTLLALPLVGAAVISRFLGPELEPEARGPGRPGSQPLVVFGTHFKTGTDLASQLVLSQTWINTLGLPLDLNTGERLEDSSINALEGTFRDPKDFYASDSRREVHFTKRHFDDIVHCGRPFKLVHFVRDPLALVVSAYLYALREPGEDGGVDPELQKKYRSMSTIAGLRMEADRQLHDVLPEIAQVEDVVRSSRLSGSQEVLSVGLEDFHDNFNATVARMYNFLLPPPSSAAASQTTRKLLDEAQIANTALWTSDLDPNHVASEDQTRQMNGVIAADSHEVWDAVRAYRALFGYHERTPGVWRLQHI